MAHSLSAKKRIRQNEKRRLRNRSVRSSVRTVIGRARTEIARDQDARKDTVLRAVRALDVAVRKGVLHPNNAARRKSRLMKQLNASLATSP